MFLSKHRLSSRRPGRRSAALSAVLPGVLLAALLISACGDLQVQKPRAFGREKEILVICEDAVWAKVEERLREKIEVPLHAVRWEPIFEISQVSAANVQHYREWDKIILIESLEDPRLLPKVVDPETMKKIGEGQGLFFTDFDIWATGQRVAGLAAPRADQLPALIAAHGDRIFQDFLRQLEKEEQERMFWSGVNQNLPDSLAACCGFRLTLPEVYARIRMDSLPSTELLYVHNEPVRSLLIRWEDHPRPLELSPEGLAAFRDSAVAGVYPTQRTLPERIDTSTVVEGGIPRLRLYGVWEDREQMSGGIYVSHLIETPDRSRRYFLDMLLFCPNPRLNKYRFLLQLDWTLNSFRFADSDLPAAAGSTGSER